MSAQNNNNGTNNNNEQEEREVEAAVGRAYVQVGDGSEDERPPVTTTQDLETAQPEEAFVATQLDVLAREQEESEGSSTEGTGPSSERSGSLPGMHGIFLKQAARDLEMATAMDGGVRQERMPSWSFTGRLSVPYGNKRGPADPATCADKSREVALMCGYHTTVKPWTAGETEAREILGLTKEDSEQVLVLSDCILRHCFRELDTIDQQAWTD